MIIRPVEPFEEFHACCEIQRRAWGYRDLDIVPANELWSVSRAGGVVLGAFEDEDRMIGFCFGLVGRDAATGKAYHFSRMLAVDPARRGRGVARALKLAQRRAVLAQGIETMRWTFDPLEALNAALNLNRLGAEAIAYHRDYFGPGTSSPLHEGIGTDRLLVEWRLRDEVRREVDPRGPRIEVPPDIQALKRAGLERARAERLRAREAFERALAEGWVAVDFQSGAYLFARRLPPPEARSPKPEA